MLKKLSLFLSVCLFFSFTSCKKTDLKVSNSVIKKYAIGTDFGGEIAIVGYQPNDLSQSPNSNIVIDLEGKELFQLPNSMVAARGRLEEEIAPVNNYIFAAKLEDKMTVEPNYDCKYVLDKNGNILLSPEKGGYDKIICDFENFSQMAKDGYLILFKENSSYSGTEKNIWVVDFDGNIIVDKILISDKSTYVISDNSLLHWEYVGDGILKVGYFLDIKSNGLLTSECPRDVNYLTSVFNRVLDENDNELFELEAHADISKFYENKAGVIYDLDTLYNKNEIYLGLINEKGQNILEPFQIDYLPEEVFVYSDGIMTVSDQYTFYDFCGNETFSTSFLDELGNGTVSEYSSGFFRILLTESVGNTMAKRGVYVNYLKDDGTWLFP